MGIRDAHFRLRLSWTMHSTLSHLQFPQGAPSTTSHRTLRALQETHARAARLLVILPAAFASVVESDRFFCVGEFDFFEALASAAGTSAGGDPEAEAFSESLVMVLMISTRPTMP